MSAWPVTREEIAEFCQAVLADNMPRHGEPWQTIAYYINSGRKRAYRMGREDGAKYGPLDCDSRLKPLVETGTGSIREADESGGAGTAIAQGDLP